jgi:hypothetical protein
MGVRQRRCRAHSDVMRAIAALLAALLLALVAIVPAGAQGGPASIATTKGSSCAHPYRVFWLVPGVDIPPIDRGNKTPGEMAGDTRFIKASAAYLGPLPHNPTPTVGRFGASWKPEVHGLKVCTARLTFTWRKPLVSHQWHPHSVIVLFNPELEHNHEALDRITSVVITAAR